MSNRINEFFRPNVLNKIKKHATDYPDQEVCGVVLNVDGIQKAYYGKNVAEDVTTHFELDDVTYRKSFEHDLVAIYHSHHDPDSSGYLSSEDIHQSKNFEIPYLLYHPYLKCWDYFDPKLTENPHPLTRVGDPKTLGYYLNWQWQWDRCDCCSLFRAYYKGMLGIELEDYPRALNSNAVFEDGWSDFETVLPQRGFERASGRVLKNDVILMCLEGTTSHHIGVMVDSNRILHLYNTTYPSRIDFYEGSSWERVTRSVWRLKT